MRRRMRSSSRGARPAQAGDEPRRVLGGEPRRDEREAGRRQPRAGERDLERAADRPGPLERPEEPSQVQVQVDVVGQRARFDEGQDGPDPRDVERMRREHVLERDERLAPLLSPAELGEGAGATVGDRSGEGRGVLERFGGLVEDLERLVGPAEPQERLAALHRPAMDVALAGHPAQGPRLGVEELERLGELARVDQRVGHLARDADETRPPGVDARERLARGGEALLGVPRAVHRPVAGGQVLGDADALRAVAGVLAMSELDQPDGLAQRVLHLLPVEDAALEVPVPEEQLDPGAPRLAREGDRLRDQRVDLRVAVVAGRLRDALHQVGEPLPARGAQFLHRVDDPGPDVQPGVSDQGPSRARSAFENSSSVADRSDSRALSPRVASIVAKLRRSRAPWACRSAGESSHLRITGESRFT